jgi:transcriptional regulator with XRE-family HTH domain
MNYRELIEQSGYKHKFVAQKIGVSKTMLSLFLSGSKNLSLEKRIKLNQLLKVNGGNE